MRALIHTVLSNYSKALNESFIQHPVASILRTTIPKLIMNKLHEPERYLIKGSAGQGNWATIPWIAIFDTLVTQTAQSGFYPVLLFKEDMKGVYLSLNQGVTDIQRKYHRKANEVLLLKAEDYRAQLLKRSSNFNLDKINLSRTDQKPSKLGELYDCGNILAKYYDAKNLPDDSTFFSDIEEMLTIYKSLVYNDSLPTNSFNQEEDEAQFIGIENVQKFRFHKRIERNQGLINKVKKYHGYRCKACYIDFSEQYLGLGKEFIEAHHLTPLSTLQGTKVELDIRNDFTVLCSNCHSMIHRLDDPSDLELLKSLVRFKHGIE